MNFELESWEIPPDANAKNLLVPIEFGPVEWNDEQTLISARWLELPSDEALAFFRPHSAEMNFVTTYGNGIPLQSSQKHVNSKHLGNVVRGSYENISGFGRLFYCHGEILIFRNGFGYGQSQDIWQREAPLEIPFDWMIESSESVFRWLQEQWAIPWSEVRFYWEWNRRTEQERTVWLGEFVPRWNELHDLMKAAAVVAELPIKAHWILDHVDTHNHSPELLARLQPWRQLFKNQFSFEPLNDAHPQFLRDYFRSASSHVQVIGEDVTAHEQIEMRLLLRDWLQHHAPEHLPLIQ